MFDKPLTSSYEPMVLWSVYCCQGNRMLYINYFFVVLVVTLVVGLTNLKMNKLVVVAVWSDPKPYNLVAVVALIQMKFDIPFYSLQTCKVAGHSVWRTFVVHQLELKINIYILRIDHLFWNCKYCFFFIYFLVSRYS